MTKVQKFLKTSLPLQEFFTPSGTHLQYPQSRRFIGLLANADPWFIFNPSDWAGNISIFFQHFTKFLPKVSKQMAVAGTGDGE